MMACFNLSSTAARSTALRRESERPSATAVAAVVNEIAGTSEVKSGGRTGDADRGFHFADIR